MSRNLLLPAVLLIIAAGCSTQHHVASKHPNGKPEVVIYTQGKGDQAVKVMEKVYYPNGKIDYVGHFKDGKEHGEWLYYYEDGTLKFKENWVDGLEDGVQVEYAPDGQPYIEKYYEKGRLVRTVDKSK